MPDIYSVKYKNPIINNIEIKTESGKYQIVEKWFAGIVPETVILDKKGKIKGEERVTGIYNISLEQYAINNKDRICEGALFLQASEDTLLSRINSPSFDLKLSNNMMRCGLSFEAYKYNPNKIMSLVSLDVWYELMKIRVEGIRFGRFLKGQLVWE